MSLNELKILTAVNINCDKIIADSLPVFSGILLSFFYFKRPVLYDAMGSDNLHY